MNWFDIGWPFVGLGGTIVMIAIMTLTDTFRGNTAVSRWRDPVWLGWLAAPIYWVHQFEELNLQVLGFDYSFQEMVCKNLSFWVIYACGIRGPLNGKVVSLAFGAGILAHIFLGLAFVLFEMGVLNGSGLLAYGVVLSFAPILIAALGSRFIRPELLRPALAP
jgi:hypothetical protein